MRKLFLFLMTVFLFSVCANKSYAIFIVDTGEPPTSSGGNVIAGQSLAARFITYDDYIVTDMKGWIGVFDPGYLFLTVYQGSLNPPNPVPDVSRVLLKQQFHIDDPDGSIGWYGVSDLYLPLAQGDYWLAFEGLRPNYSFVGYMPPDTPPFLPNYAWSNADYDIGYQGFADNPSAAAFGIQIQGERWPDAPVPEPATIFLLGGGLAAAIWRRRKIAKA